MSKEMIHECDNCGWKGSEDELGCTLEEMSSLLERIDPGCPVPSGDCPECRACCYPLDENERMRRAFPELLEALRECETLIDLSVCAEYLHEDSHPGVHSLLSNIRRVIAKATQE